MSEEQTKEQATKRRKASRAWARPVRRPKKKSEGRGASGATVKAPFLKKRAEKPAPASSVAASEQEDSATGIRRPTRFLRALVVTCVAILVAVALLYGPARGLYCAWRENSELKAQDAQALSEKGQIEEDISDLTSKDGIKDQAREMGYVDEGETRIIVEGGEEDEGAEAPDDASAEDVPSYLQFFDLVFGYKEGQ